MTLTGGTITLYPYHSHLPDFLLRLQFSQIFCCSFGGFFSLFPSFSLDILIFSFTLLLTKIFHLLTCHLYYSSRCYFFVFFYYFPPLCSSTAFSFLLSFVTFFSLIVPPSPNYLCCCCSLFLQPSLHR